MRKKCIFRAVMAPLLALWLLSLAACGGSETGAGGVSLLPNINESVPLCGTDAQGATEDCYRFVEVCNDEAYDIPDDDSDGVVVVIPVWHQGIVASVAVSSLEITHD